MLTWLSANLTRIGHRLNGMGGVRGRSIRLSHVLIAATWAINCCALLPAQDQRIFPNGSYRLHRQRWGGRKTSTPSLKRLTEDCGSERATDYTVSTVVLQARKPNFDSWSSGRGECDVIAKLTEFAKEFVGSILHCARIRAMTQLPISNARM